MTGPDPRAGQEAARLLAAAQDWLRTSAPHLAPLAPDGEPCSCPVCRSVAGLREVDPEAVGRWVDSAVTTIGSLVAQAGDLAPSRSPGSTDDDADDAADDDADGSDDADDDADGSNDADARGRGDVGDDDGYMTTDDSRAEGATDDEPSGQDGPRARRVRRVPITREDETDTSTS